MKKNKTIAYLMAATLLVGGTFLGTKALFTDKVDMAGEISISTGDVDLQMKTLRDWTLQRNGDEDLTGTNGKTTFDNLKTGDVLMKTVKITNAGTLKSIVDLEKEIRAFELPEGIEYTATVQMGDKLFNDGEAKGIVMNPNDTMRVNLQIKVTGGGQHNIDGSLNNDVQEKVIVDLKDSYTVKAKQQNIR